MKKITIGIITYNRNKDFIETIKLINRTKYPIDLIIVDNNKKNDLYNDIKNILFNNKYITLTYIWEGKNLGVAGGRNRIFKKLETPYLILLDDDIYLEDINIVIEKVIQTFDKENKVGGIAFHLVNYHTKKELREEIPHANKNINLNRDFYTYILIGAGHALRKEVIEKVGLLDETFGFYGMEEIDYAFRIINKGYSIKFVQDIIVYHKKSPFGRMTNEYVFYRQFINRVGISIKYLKYKYIISSFVIWYLYASWKAKKLLSIKSTFNDLKIFFKKRKPFGKNFYMYIKKYNGRLWY